MEALENGYVQVYTGDGKGKTTAALGLTLRAVGAGLEVFIGQFLKTGTYSEVRALERLGPSVVLEQFGGKRFIRQEPTEEDRKRALAGLERVREVVLSGEYDLVILEEINVAVSMGLVSASEVLDLIREKPSQVELVLTGRRAAPEILDAADLVTEMREVKHYYKRGVTSRKGIEK
jgi:cob(I)alamin adenosyltransferase